MLIEPGSGPDVRGLSFLDEAKPDKPFPEIMKKSLFVAWALGASLLASSSVQAQVISATPQKPAAEYTEQDLKNLGSGVAFPYELLDNVLKANVDAKGDIYYAKVKNNNDLEVFVRAVSVADLSQFPSWKTTVPPDPDRPQDAPKVIDDKRPLIAFWINAYNALFLKAVADVYPVNSINDIKDLDTAKTRVVGGQSYSFAEMRKIIADLDPRALFALNDGTRNGPRVQPMAYRFSTLGDVLDQLVRAYVNDQSRVQILDRGASGQVEVSPWFKNIDPLLKANSRRRKYEGIRSILAGYGGTARGFFAAGEYSIDFKQPEKGLNEQLSR
jgi:hypothetical protein